MPHLFLDALAVPEHFKAKAHYKHSKHVPNDAVHPESADMHLQYSALCRHTNHATTKGHRYCWSRKSTEGNPNASVRADPLAAIMMLKCHTTTENDHFWADQADAWQKWTCQLKHAYISLREVDPGSDTAKSCAAWE